MKQPRKQYFYQFNSSRCWWARIWVTDDGSISILSDYGNYGYWFTATGGEIRNFLIGVDPGPEGYMANKLADGKRVYDSRSVFRNVKRHILEHRRDRTYTKEFALEEWIRLHNCSDLSEEANFNEWYLETEIEDASSFYETCIHQQLQQFMKDCWPVFVEMMKAELAAESHPMSTGRAMLDMGT